MSEFSSFWLKFQLVGFIQHSSQLKSLWKWILSSMVLAVFPGFNPLAAAKSLQSCLTLCTPQTAAHQTPLSLGFARQEHWSVLPFPSPMHENENWKVKMKLLSHVRLLVTLWTAAYQAPLSMGFSRQQYWSGVPLPSLLIHLPIR